MNNSNFTFGVLHIASTQTQGDGEFVPLYHKILASNFTKIQIFENPTKLTIKPYKRVIKDPSGSDKDCVAHTIKQITKTNFGRLATFYGNTYTLPVLYYRSFVHGIKCENLFSTYQWPKTDTEVYNVDLAAIFSNNNKIKHRKFKDFAEVLLGLTPRKQFIPGVNPTKEEMKKVVSYLAIDSFAITALFLRHLVITENFPALPDWSTVVDELYEAYNKAYAKNKTVQKYLDKNIKLLKKR